MVSDSKDINPRTVRAHNLSPGSVTTAKAGKKIIHTEAADPTTAADAGTGYAVGSVWCNTSSGEVFICTDSSEEDSIWYGQEGEGINLPVQHSMGADNYFFTGPGPGSGYAGSGSVIKLIFSSDADSDTGYDMQTPAVKYNDVGHHSTTEMFTSGGTGATDNIQKMTFAALADSTDHGEITAGSEQHAGLSSTTHGYAAGGKNAVPFMDRIEKFTFAAPNTTTDVGELNETVKATTGISGTIQGKGWVCGGCEPPNNIVDTIQVMSFDSGEQNATDWGELSALSGNNVGHNDATNGFIDRNSGGPGNQSNQTNNRDTFALASAGNGTDSGECVTTTFDRAKPGGISATHGYSCLGYYNGPPYGGDWMEKFAFASPYAGSDIGEAPSDGYGGMGASD